MRILFLGAGAIGGYFGGKLAAAGADVHFLVRPGRAEQLKTGLVVKSPLGDFSTPVRALTDADPGEAFDIVVLTCKAYGLEGALRAVSPHVTPGTVILPFLNGFAHMRTIEAAFPEAHVWGGVAQIAATLDAQGTIHHLNTGAMLTIGSRDGQAETTTLAERFVALVKASGAKGLLSARIEQDLWNKWVFLASLAGATCLMRAPIGAIMQSEGGEAFLEDLFAECAAIAQAHGRQPEPDKMAGYRQLLTDRNSTLTASLLRDLESGAPTEADHIIGDLYRHGRDRGVTMPCLTHAWVHLQSQTQKAG